MGKEEKEREKYEGNQFSLFKYKLLLAIVVTVVVLVVVVVIVVVVIFESFLDFHFRYFEPNYVFISRNYDECLEQ